MDSGAEDGSTVVCVTAPHNASNIHQEKPMAVQVAPEGTETEPRTPTPTPPPLSPTETNANEKATARAEGTTDAIATCDSTDKLLATDDSSQGTLSQDDDPAAQDVPMEDVREQETGAPEPPRFEEISAGGDVTMDGGGDDETVSVEATTDTEAEEHPALEHERRWFAELPAFVKRVYADQPNRRSRSPHEQQHIEPTDHGFPECVPCAANQRRALSSVVCMQTNCALKDKALCSSCFMNDHSGSDDILHLLRVTKACPQCHTSRVAVWCEACDLSFCRECFVEIHGGVKKTMTHKTYRLDGVTGKMFPRANWSPHFRQVVLEMRDEQLKNTRNVGKTTGKDPRLEAALPPFHGKYESKVTLKRKRPSDPQEVICIDDDEAEAEPNASPATRSRPVSPPASALAMATPPTLENNHQALQQRPPQRPPQHMAAPIPAQAATIDQALMTRAGYFADMPVTPPPPPAMQSFVAVPSSSVPSPVVTSMPASSMPYVPPVNSNAQAWAPAPMATTPTTPQGPASIGNASPGGSAMSNPLNPLDQNPIEQVLYDRLDRVNGNMTRIERVVTELNGQVVQASYQSVQAAHNFMVTLQQHQQQLAQLKVKRDVVVVQLVAQSRSIIQKVKTLRLDLLGDIPQVQTACYRRCLELSMLIKQAEAVVIKLNARMSETLEQVGTVSNEVFHRTVSSVSTAIQTHEQETQRLRDERENEIVRLVQYHHGVRDMLKRAVQQQQHFRHQQELQQQQQLQQQQEDQAQQQQQGQPQQQQQPQQQVHQPQQQQQVQEQQAHQQQVQDPQVHMPQQQQQQQQIHLQQQQQHQMQLQQHQRQIQHQLIQQQLQQQLAQQQQHQSPHGQQQQQEPSHLQHLQNQLQLTQQQIQQRIFHQQQQQQQLQQSPNQFSAPMQQQPLPMPPYIGAPAPPQTQQNGEGPFGNPPVSRPSFP